MPLAERHVERALALVANVAVGFACRPERALDSRRVYPAATAMRRHSERQTYSRASFACTGATGRQLGGVALKRRHCVGTLARLQHRHSWEAELPARPPSPAQRRAPASDGSKPRSCSGSAGIAPASNASTRSGVPGRRRPHRGRPRALSRARSRSRPRHEYRRPSGATPLNFRSPRRQAAHKI